MLQQTVDRYEVKIAALERKISEQQRNYDDLSKTCLSLESRLSNLENSVPPMSMSQYAAPGTVRQLVRFNDDMLKLVASRESSESETEEVPPPMNCWTSNRERVAAMCRQKSTATTIKTAESTAAKPTSSETVSKDYPKATKAVPEGSEAKYLQYLGLLNRMAALGTSESTMDDCLGLAQQCRQLEESLFSQNPESAKADDVAGNSLSPKVPASEGTVASNVVPKVTSTVVTTMKRGHRMHQTGDSTAADKPTSSNSVSKDDSENTENMTEGYEPNSNRLAWMRATDPDLLYQIRNAKFNNGSSYATEFPELAPRNQESESEDDGAL